MPVEVESIYKSFAGTRVLRGVSLELGDGEVVALLGPSGSGKTTLLRIIAGLERADSGHVLLDGRDLSAVPPYRRGFGFVFQDYALFPHKSVGENVAFGLRMQAWQRRAIEARVAEVLALVGLSGFADRRVFDLSGGEQQRVALARSLAPSPPLMLLDEPLGALDRALRERLMLELRAILKGQRSGRAGELGSRGASLTAIYVTHDQAEAFAVADRVAVMRDGLIEQLATPIQLYREPASAFVARFLGMENILPAEHVAQENSLARTPIGPLRFADVGRSLPERLSLLIRPEAARLVACTEEVVNRIAGQLHNVSFRGRHQEARVAVPATGEASESVVLEFEFDSTIRLPQAGESLCLALEPQAILPLDTR